VKKIFFCHTGLATFVASDLKILSETYQVLNYEYTLGTNRLRKIINIFTSFFSAVYYVPKIDVIYVWFAGYHGFFPILIGKLLRKKTIVIVGGYDASYVPSIPYGVFYGNGMFRWCVEWIYKNVDHILPVDESLVESTNYYADPSVQGYKTGILNHVKGVDQSKIKVVYLGYDKIEDFEKKRSISVVCIALVNDDKTFKLKGWDMILNLANKMPTVDFILIGANDRVKDELLSKKWSNIKLVNAPDFGDVINSLLKAKVVLHPSLTEGFCSVITEGMLCGCVPVGSAVGGIPRSIGDAGFVIKEQNVDAYINAILLAIENFDQLSHKAIERANTLYPLEKRKVALFNIIEQ
jgi:glycosyltransferase involved in cell wall biosynthesis